MRHRLRLRLLPPAVILACALGAPTGAVGAGSSGMHVDPASGLHVDPASPVAKAYALPLGSAAGTPTGEHGRTLFGSGITRQLSARPAAYRLQKPGSAGLALMGLVAAVVVGIGAAGAVAFSRRR